MPTLSVSSRVLAGAGIVGLLLLATIAARWGLADLYDGHARGWLTRWMYAGEVTNEESWESAHAALKNALRLQPSNPNTLADAGRLYDWKVIDQENTPQPAADGTEPLGYYRRAILEQPTWPHYWVNLALAKYRAEQLDDELNFAIQRAAEFGPWESNIQFGLVSIGTAAWNKLTQESREITLTALERGLQGERARAFLGLVEKRGWLGYVCRQFSGENPRLAKYCKRKKR